VGHCYSAGGNIINIIVGQRIYVAGPITGYDLDERVKAFESASNYLRENGWEPVNPLTLHPLNIKWEEALRADLTGLVTCEAIYLMVGYSKSRGAQLELHVARELGLREFYQEGPETVAQEAERVVSGDRGPQYGHPTKNFEQTASLWNAYLGEPREITPADVAIMMILLKLSRESNRPKRDNVVDVIGYAKTLAMVRGYE
jgi:hypothetical protein